MVTSQLSILPVALQPLMSYHTLGPGWPSCVPLSLFLAQGSFGQFSLFQVSSKIP